MLSLRDYSKFVSVMIFEEYPLFKPVTVICFTSNLYF